MKIYSIKDTVTGIHETIFTQINDMSAKRLLEELAKDEKHPIYHNYQDKQLFSIADFNEISGNIEPKLEMLANLTQFKKIEQEEQNDNNNEI